MTPRRSPHPENRVPRRAPVDASKAAHIAKNVVVIAGPNRAGKTTFAREFLPKEAECPDFINVDLIAAGLSPFAPERSAVYGAQPQFVVVTLH